MADKTVKELADMVGKTTSAVQQQLVDAGLPTRAEDDLVTEVEQEKLVTYLKQSHGQQEKRRISLKSKTTSTARVTGSSGKSKSVNVEVRKKKVFEKPDPEKMAEELAAREQAMIESQERAAKDAEERAATKKKSEERQAATLAAMRASLGSSKKSDDKNDDISTSVVVKKGGKAAVEVKPKEQPKKKVAATKPKVETAAERKAREVREKEENRLRQIETETRQAQAKEAQKRTLEQMRKMAGQYTDQPAAEVRKDEPLAEGLVGDALEESFEKERREIKRGASSTGARGRRRKNQDEREIKNRKNGLRSSQSTQHKFEKPLDKIIYDVEISEQITVADLAQRMAVKAREVTKLLMKMGEMARESDMIDQATASLLVEEMGHNPVPVSDTKVEDDLQYAVDERSSNIQTRPPVVTIMGHVDHGKTSLLDKIRETKVATGEAGGITQHIGAYHVKTDRGVITFLDTPGHAAFSAMRSRGAQATDIVVIVVAADDGMMPQTAEAIDHARAAGTPIIVAINKMDKPSADPDRVLNELTTKEVVSEEWGGDTPMARISAKTGEGIDELLEFISLQAELMELEAPLDGAAQGVVIESRLEKGRGPVVSVLVKKGTLKQGDLVLAGEHYGKVRAMTNESGQRIKTAGPSIPVEILGLPETPAAGSEFLVVTDEKKAREVADFRTNRERERQLERQNAMRLESMFDQMEQGDVSFLNIVLKTDVRGSLEALLAALNELSTDEVKVRVISSGVGPISESDVTLAESSEAVLLGFNVRADATARRKADAANMDIRYYSVIYGLIDDVKAAMSGMLAPEHREKILGVADVREVFRSSKFGAAAGCMVVEGTIYRNKPIRVLRDDQVIFTGHLQSLRRYKEDVNEVRTGMECGLAVRGYDVEAGDKIEVFEIQEFARTI
ncbi:translation initiation factor IF-2 [Psychrobacter sp. AOP22-C1-22]|uniref:translation initiation factor IF-2 n=1 Tax=unclassified Psychrobacter TaxID=196806 RepID=UPI0017880371|nr:MULTISPECIES: translation initiation factor IF-2 [unclassified Psychrobacter]MBE0406372.1 translation initiation factor IF-2 [Psychrobacter sp. FME6]MBE0444408.1 translation initiation factor IF-2 [Psychrobacter sp. FME5]MDN5802161.1 translation initiation factor IF-2 [Psychrobacter sp.]